MKHHKPSVVSNGISHPLQLISSLMHCLLRLVPGGFVGGDFLPRLLSALPSLPTSEPVCGSSWILQDGSGEHQCSPLWLMPGHPPMRCPRYQASGGNPKDHLFYDLCHEWSLPWPCQVSLTLSCQYSGARL